MWCWKLKPLREPGCEGQLPLPTKGSASSCLCCDVRANLHAKESFEHNKSRAFVLFYFAYVCCVDSIWWFKHPPQIDFQWLILIMNHMSSWSPFISCTGVKLHSGWLMCAVTSTTNNRKCTMECFDMLRVASPHSILLYSLTSATASFTHIISCLYLNLVAHSVHWLCVNASLTCALAVIYSMVTLYM